MSQSRSLSPRQIKRVLSTCLLMQNAEAKRCALAFSFAACRVTETARIAIKDILHPSGIIKEEVHLRGAICKNGRARTLWLTNSQAREIIQQYLDYRLSKNWGISVNSNQYQGLIPDSVLLFNNRGRPYSLTAKRRILLDGTAKTYWCCDALEQQIRMIYKRCGLHHCSSHAGRRSMVSNAVLRGVELEQLAIALGHSQISTTLGYVDISQKQLAYACSVALD